MVRVLIAGVAPCLARALRDLLAEKAGLAVVGLAADADETIAQAAALGPDVVVLNLRVRGLNGLEVTRRLRGAARQSRVVLVGDEDDDVYHAAARTAGAGAYLTWLTVGERLLPALRALDVSAGTPAGTAAAAAPAAPVPSPASARVGAGAAEVLPARAWPAPSW